MPLSLSSLQLLDGQDSIIKSEQSITPSLQMQIGITQQEIDKGVSFQEAITKVKYSTVFQLTRYEVFPSSAQLLLAALYQDSNILYFQFNHYLSQIGGNVRVICDGPSHLRQCLHPDSVRRDCALSTHCNTFTDIRYSPPPPPPSRPHLSPWLKLFLLPSTSLVVQSIIFLIQTCFSFLHLPWNSRVFFTAHHLSTARQTNRIRLQERVSHSIPYRGHQKQLSSHHGAALRSRHGH